MEIMGAARVLWLGVGGWLEVGDEHRWLIALMLTGSMALYHYAQPRMTRDIDIVLALVLKDLETFPKIFGDEFYFSPEAAREAVFRQSYFNVIHNESLIK